MPAADDILHATAPLIQLDLAIRDCDRVIDLALSRRDRATFERAAAYRAELKDQLATLINPEES